jgi:hypothetical protein
VEAAAVEQEVGCAGAQRQHRDVGAGEADLPVADGGPGKRGSRQIHAQAMPAPSRQIPELGAQSAPEVDDHSRAAQRAVVLGRDELRGRRGQVPPPAGAGQVWVNHAARRARRPGALA